MKKNSNPKCPNCDYKVELTIQHDECIFCGGGVYWECPKCWSNFAVTKKNKVGDEL
jgi:hypothetical protein